MSFMIGLFVITGGIFWILVFAFCVGLGAAKMGIEK